MFFFFFSFSASKKSPKKPADLYLALHMQGVPLNKPGLLCVFSWAGAFSTVSMKKTPAAVLLK